MHEELNKLLHEAHQKKIEEVLKNSFKSKGLKFDTLAKHARFPDITAEKREGWTFYYYNDGTIEGKFIIKISDPTMTFTSSAFNKVTAHLEFKTSTEE